MKLRTIMENDFDFREGGFYWIKYRESDQWEVARFKGGNFKLTDGSRIEPARIFKIDKRELVK